MVGSEEVGRSIAVHKFFPSTEAEGLDRGRTKMAGDFLAIAALQSAVLQSDHKTVVGDKAVKQGLVKSGDETRIDERGFNASVFQRTAHLLAQSEEIA